MIFDEIKSKLICSNGYGGKRIFVVDEERIAFIFGRGLKFVNIETNTEELFAPDLYIYEGNVNSLEEDKNDDRSSNVSSIDYLEEEDINKATQKRNTMNSSREEKHLYLTAGISAVAFNSKRKIFAIVDRYINPKIRIYNSTTFELIKVISVGTSSLEFKDLDFSRDGEYLASLSELPDHKISVWDWEKGKKLVETKSAQNSHFVSFNPRNKEQLCTSGPSHLAFWIINTSVNGFNLLPIEPKVSETIYEKIKLSNYYKHEWGLRNDILCVTNDGDFLHFENIFSNGTTIEFDFTSDPMYSLAVSKHLLIIGCNEGNLKLLRMSHLYNIHLFNEDDKTSSKVINTSMGSSEIMSVVISGNFKYIIAGTADGNLYKIYIKGFNNPEADDIGLLKTEPIISTLCDYHVGAVTGIQYLEPRNVNDIKTLVITCGVDGTIRVCNYKTNTLISKRNFHASFVCSSYSNGRLFVGSALGYFRVFEFDEKYQPVLIYCQKLRNSPITNIRLGGPSESIAVITFEDKFMGFIRISKTQIKLTTQDGLDDLVDYEQSFDDETEEFSFLGFCKYNNQITAISWAYDTGIYVATEVGDVYLIEPPSFVNEDYIQLNTVTKEMWKLDYPCYGIVPFKDDYHHIYAISQDKSLKIYDLSGEDRQSSISNNVITPTSELLCHYKLGECIVLSPYGNILATGAKDGLLWIRLAQTSFYDTGEEEIAQMHANHCPGDGGISCVGLSSDGNYIFSGGHDGAVFIYSLIENENPIDGCLTMSIPKSFTKDKVDSAYESADHKTITDIKLENQKKIESVLNESKKESIKSAIEELRKEFEDLKLENSELNDEEKLSESEFIIDPDYKKILEEEGDKECEKIKEQARIENLKKDILAKRIKKECWDSMEEHATSIKAFNMIADHIRGNPLLEVYNYVIKKKDPKKEKLLEKILFMRRVEEVSLCDRRKEFITNDIEGGMIDEDEANRSTPKLLDRSDLSDKDLAEATDSNEGTRKYSSIRKRVILDSSNLLYPYTDLFTRHRKVTQILLLQDKVDKLMKQFNSEFKYLKDEKIQAIRKIERINEKISDIVKDLVKTGQEATTIEVFEPKLSKEEQPETYVLNVLDEELTTERYISQEERDKLEEKKRFENEQLKKTQDKDMIERALTMMMDGKLQIENDDVKEEELLPPACFGKDKAELTEQEMKEMKEYESLIKIKEEERVKKVKQLEAKLKNAKQQITDLCLEFDGNVKNLFIKRLSVDQLIFETELQMIKLSQSIIQHEEYEKTEKQLNLVLDELKKKRAGSASVIQEFAKKLNVEKTEHERLIAEDKQMERSFKAQFLRDVLQLHFSSNQQLLSQQHKKLVQQKTQNSMNADVQKLQHAMNMKVNEMIEKLYKLYRTRPKLTQPNIIQTEIEMRAESEIDPFADIDISEELKNVPLKDPLDKEKNRPLYIADDELWDKFWEAREAKIQMDINVRDSQFNYDQMLLQLNRLKEEDAELERIMSKDMSDLNEFRERITTESYNLDKLFKFKQGQVEVEQAAVVTDYSDAILISKSSINELNSNIKLHGQEIVKQLTKTKDLKKKIRKIQWENDLLSFDTDDLIFKFKRLQMLKVKKEMQDLIKRGGGTEEKQKLERAKLQKQIDNTKTSLEQSLAEKKRILKRMEEIMHERYNENTQLLKQIKLLEQVVEERKQLHFMQSNDATKEQCTSDRRMKQLRWERKLSEIVKEQESEIAYLMEELERLKKRSFPSFAVVERRRI